MLGLLIVLPLLFFGCERGKYADWRYPGGDRDNSRLVTLSWEPEWQTTPIGQAKITFAGHRIPVPFFGDVRGGPENEVVLVSARRLQIYSLDAELLVDLRFRNYDRVPGFLLDWDGDRKLDIVLGSEGAAEPAITVRNGQGKLVGRHAITAAARDYGSFEPVLEVQDRIYALTTETVPSSPRGIISLTRRGTEKWEFYLPVEPLGLDLQYQRDGSPLLVVSHMTRHTGAFRKFGTEGIPRKGFDSSLHLLRVDPRGNVVNEYRLADEGGPLIGRGNYTPLGDRASKPLLLKEDTRAVPGHEGAKRVTFHLVEPESGTLLASRRASAERLVDYQPVVVPDREESRDARLAVLSRAGSELALRLFDEELSPVYAVGMGHDSGRFGPVVRRGATSPLHYMVMTEAGLCRVTRAGGLSRLAAARNPQRMILAAAKGARRQSAVLILVGRYLEIFRLH
jgi:hypothetical protein